MTNTYKLYNQYSHGDDIMSSRDNDTSRGWLDKIWTSQYKDNVVFGNANLQADEYHQRKMIISNFVRIITDNPNIRVQYATAESLRESGGHATYNNDGTPIILINPVTGENNLDVVIGLGLHEGSHIKFTDFTARKKYEYSLPKVAMEEIFQLENWIEDRRIDGLVKKQFPGYIGYYNALYKRYFSSKADADELNAYTKPIVRNYLNQIFLGVLNPYFKSQLPRFDEVLDLMRPAAIVALESTSDSIVMAIQVYLKIVEIVNNPNQKSEQKPNENNSSSEDNKDQKEQPSESKDGNNSKKDKSKDPSDGDQSDDQNDDDENDDSGDETQEDESGDDDSNDSDSGNDDATNEEISQADIDAAKNSLEEEKKKGFKFSDFHLNEESNRKGTDTLSGGLEQKLKDVLEFLESKAIKTVDDDTNTKVELLDLIEQKSIFDGGLKHTKFYSIPDNALTRILKDDSISRATTDTMCNASTFNTALKQGTALSGKLKIQSESRELKTVNLKSGRLNKRSIFKGEFNENMFETLNTNTPGRKLVHIDIDGSSSMNSRFGTGNKSPFVQSMAFALTVAKACSLIKNLDCEIWIRYSSDSLFGGHHNVLLEIYNSRKGQTLSTKRLMFIGTLSGTGGTPEGECYKAALKMNLIPTSTAHDKAYFITLSDGQPDNSDLVKEAAAQIKKKLFTKAFFIGNETYRSKDSAKNNRDYRMIENMWGSGHAAYINYNNLNEVAAEISTLLRK